MGTPTRHKRRRALALAAALSLCGCEGPAAREPARYYAAALADHRRGDYHSALKRARSAQADISEQRNLEWRWRFRLLEAETLISTGEAAEAVRLLEPRPGFALSVRSLEPRRLLDLGWACSFLSEYEKSLALLSEAASLATQNGDSEALAQTELRRGTVLVHLKRFDEAERAYLASLKLARALADPYLEGSALGSLGYLRLRAARYEEAVYFFDQVLPLARKSQSRSLEALTVQNLAWCHFRLGDLDRAARAFEIAPALFREMGKLREMEVSLGNLGSVYLLRGDFRRAIRYYEQALAAARKIKHNDSAADWLTNLAAAHIELADFGAASRLNAEAARLSSPDGSRPTGALVQLNQARLLEHAGRSAEAEAAYRKVAGSGTLEPTVRLDARSRLAGLLAAAGRTKDADVEYRRVLEELEDYRLGLANPEWRMSWQASLIRFYKAYVAFLWGTGRREEALEVAESSRARVLSAQLAGTIQQRARTAAQMRALAGAAGCRLLSYWLSRDASYLWEITGQAIVSHLLPPQREIAEAAAAYQRAIERLRDPVQGGLPAAERLARALLGPLKNRSGCFWISPDQELHAVNFETLPVEGGRYWVETATISVTPSLAFSVSRTDAGRQAALLLGDPEPADPVEYPRLMHAGGELREIAKLLGPRPVRIVQGAEATPASYRKAEPGRFAIIHIASHANANRESPLDSAIILSRERERYSLTAREIAAIPISANLVTLSACRGAGSRAYAGEGTVGLAWSFLHAGARNVIAGLWAVDDVSTARLMGRMYAHLAAGRDPASALRAAKLEFIAGGSAFRKPFYWAPFQVYRLP